jgi:hypothetical protein
MAEDGGTRIGFALQPACCSARVIHAALINPCQPSVAKRPTVRGWVARNGQSDEDDRAKRNEEDRTIY